MNEDSIRPDALRPDLAAAVQRDRQWLLAREAEFVYVDCPVCDTSSNTNPWRIIDGFQYRRCSDCGTLYISPRPTQELLNAYYARSEIAQCWCEEIYPAAEDTRAAELHRPRVYRIIGLAQKLGVRCDTLVDIGAGYGTFCAEAARQGFRCVAVEPSIPLAGICASRYLDTRACSLNEANLPQDSASVVTAFEVIEHVTAPRWFLRTCYRILAPGGLLALTCPNADGFDVQVLGATSSTIGHEHLTYFTPESLPTLLEAVGFEVVEVDTPGKLDLELVHKAVVAGAIVTPWIRYLVVDRWDKIDRQAVQQCLADNLLSSHLWVVARKPKED